MKTTDRNWRSEQLTLFEQRPIRPSWDAIPLDTRQELVRILTKMFVERRVRDRRWVKGADRK